MRRSLHAWTVLFAWLLAAPLMTAAGTPPPAEAFGALPQTDDAVLSPDGNTLAWNLSTGTQQKVVVVDVTTGKDKRTAIIPEGNKLRSLHWSDNDTLLLGLSATVAVSPDEAYHYEFSRVVALDVNSGESTVLLMTGGGYRATVTGADLLATHTPKPKTVIMATFDNRIGWSWNLYLVDTHTGGGKLIEQGSAQTVAWVIDKEGNAVARADWDGWNHVLRVLAKSGLGWREILRQEKRNRLALIGTTPDGTAILALGSLDAGYAKLLAIPLDGSPPRVLVDDPEHEVDSVVRNRFTLAPIAAVLGGADLTYRWLDPQEQQRHEVVAKAFPAREVSLYSESQDHQRVIARVRSASLPAAFYLVDFKTHKADVIGEEYPQLANVSLGEVKSISYKARDGTNIPAYLTLPPGAADKNLPLVVLPHGGPEARDVPRFDWWAQFLATRGYAVLQPQFRGSTGFGDAFRLAGRQQWGGLMQDDVTDGVKFLTAQGIADPRRVCIVGASYGGYAALAGAAFTPDLYVCAVSINGISNLPEMSFWLGKHSGYGAVTSWQESIGTHLAPAQAHSPKNAAAQVRAPVLIMYSSDDTVVPPSQSQDMARALTQSGKSVKLVKLEGDDHGLSRTQTRTQMLKELETFLAVQLH